MQSVILNELHLLTYLHCPATSDTGKVCGTQISMEEWLQVSANEHLENTE